MHHDKKQTSQPKVSQPEKNLAPQTEEMDQSQVGDCQLGQSTTDKLLVKLFNELEQLRQGQQALQASQDETNQLLQQEREARRKSDQRVEQLTQEVEKQTRRISHLENSQRIFLQMIQWLSEDVRSIRSALSKVHRQGEQLNLSMEKLPHKQQESIDSQQSITQQQLAELMQKQQQMLTLLEDVKGKPWHAKNVVNTWVGFVAFNGLLIKLIEILSEAQLETAASGIETAASQLLTHMIELLRAIFMLG